MQSFEQPARTLVYRLPRTGTVQLDIFPSHPRHKMIVHTPGGDRLRIPNETWCAGVGAVARIPYGPNTFLYVDRHGQVYFQSSSLCNELTRNPIALLLINDNVPYCGSDKCAYVRQELNPPPCERKIGKFY